MRFFSTLGSYFLMLKGMFTKPENFKMYWKELMHQCVEIGIGSLGIVSIISVFMGAVSAAQTAYHILAASDPKLLKAGKADFWDSGKKDSDQSIQITYKGKNIADILAMSVQESVAFFESIPVIHRRLTTLNQVGLGYIHLGQSATTLSGGEAQRIKLATELSKVSTGKTLYILDEPTTGLHPLDVKLLLEVLQKLVDKGNTVLVIEHNLDIVKCSDWIVDMGPEGGEAGGEIIAMGTPEQVAKNKNSYTGFYLKEVL